ncbi:MAG: hypothetical protein ACI87N_000153 [Flavobacteriales bacterium]|jgi:hypothetical protein
MLQSPEKKSGGFSLPSGLKKNRQEIQFRDGYLKVICRLPIIQIAMLMKQYCSSHLFLLRQ